MDADKFKFRTEVSILKSPFSISHESTILLAGSCFADMIGQKLSFNKFNCLTNPYGNIYNPISLFKLLQHSLNNTFPEEWSYLQNQGRWVNYLFHSEIFGKTKKDVQEKINNTVLQVKEFLKKTDFLILTLGTSWVYKLIDTNYLVANCHKEPLKYFHKYLLSPKEIIDEYELLRKLLLEERPNLRVIFTVSPVRHLKDTIPLNNLSKSILRTAIHYINESYPETSYFPSYEIMIDDLRDYRFFKNDMIHPTEMAEDYIWEKFIYSYFNTDTLTFLKDWGKLSKALTHRPFNPGSEEHQKFITDTLYKIQLLQKKAEFSEEIRILKEQIRNWQ